MKIIQAFIVLAVLTAPGFAETFPDDADGQALERLQTLGLDFNEKHDVDFQIEFRVWPPSSDALVQLRKLDLKFSIYEPHEEYNGYIEVTINEIISHAFVQTLQRELTTIMGPFGGSCNSWGVMIE